MMSLLILLSRYNSHSQRCKSRARLERRINRDASSSHKPKRGFSLVELSIVLVILGLLTGGILSGQSLIRAAELRKVTTDLNKYVVAIYSFRDRYNALPGDISNASMFWPSETYMAGCGATTPGNGNNNGMMGYHAGGDSCESAWLWKHLRLSGLIEGNYDGMFNGRSYVVIGTHVPASVGKGGYLVTYDDGIGNRIRAASLSHSNNQMKGPLLNTNESWNIDTKLDDGKPTFGSFLGNDGNDAAGSAVSPPCVDAATSDYALSGNAFSCWVSMTID